MKTGRVYRITHDTRNIVYIGSTFNTLRRRWQGHLGSFKLWLNGGPVSKCSIYAYFKEYGTDGFRISLIKEYQVEDRRHLNAYETLWVCNTKGCVNKYLPLRILRKERERQYYRENRDDRLAYGLKYYKENRDARLAYGLRYYQENRAKKLLYQKQYRLKASERSETAYAARKRSALASSENEAL